MAEMSECDCLYAKQRAAIEKLRALRDTPHFANAKSALIGCKCCGSKISRDHLNKKENPNVCPVCGTDLRPKTTLDAIDRAIKECEKIAEQIRVAEEKI